MLFAGGHNYCRNPGGEQAEPWCFTNDDVVEREACAVRQCSVFNLWLYIAVPAVSAVAVLGLTIGLCCMRRRAPPAQPIAAAGSVCTGHRQQPAGPSVTAVHCTVLYTVVCTVVYTVLLHHN